jgi:hypothetical protein
MSPDSEPPRSRGSVSRKRVFPQSVKYGLGTKANRGGKPLTTIVAQSELIDPTRGTIPLKDR